MACSKAWRQVTDSHRGNCDEACLKNFVEFDVPNLLLRELSDVIRDFSTKRVSALVVDVTGNGGGQNWVDPAARVFSTIELKCPEMRFIKHQHWLKRFKELSGKTNSDLLNTPQDSNLYALLSLADKRVKGLIEAAGTGCDLSSIWEEKSVAYK
jgi:hypothetical protein